MGEFKFGSLHKTARGESIQDITAESSDCCSQNSQMSPLMSLVQLKMRQALNRKVKTDKHMQKLILKEADMPSHQRLYSVIFIICLQDEVIC